MMSESKICTSMVPVKQDSKICSFVKTVLKHDELGHFHQTFTNEEKESPVNQELSLNQTASITTEDDDEHSQGSFSTLLSELCSTDDSPFESISSDLEELEKDFARRDKLLMKLVQGIDPIYACIMRENEHAVRQLKLQQLQEDQKQKQSPQHPIDANTDKLAVRKRGQIRLLESMRRAFAFEAQNTLPAGIIIIFNCIAYGCCNQAIIRVINAIAEDYGNQVLVSVVVILFSIVLLRFTGGLWEFVSCEAYEQVKFDMHNRLRLGKIDALIMHWFHKHPNMHTLANVFAFFASYESACCLHERCLAAFDQRDIIFQSLPSVKQGMVTTINEKIAKGVKLETVHRHLANEAFVAGESLYAVLADQDRACLKSVLSRDSYDDFFGWEATVLIGEWTMFGYFAVSAFLSIFLLRRMGHKFWAHEHGK